MKRPIADSAEIEHGADRFFREMLDLAKLELDYETMLYYTDEWWK